MRHIKESNRIRLGRALSRSPRISVTSQLSDHVEFEDQDDEDDGDGDGDGKSPTSGRRMTPFSLTPEDKYYDLIEAIGGWENCDVIHAVAAICSHPLWSVLSMSGCG